MTPTISLYNPFPSLTITVHGESGSGKSWFADTAPGPKLVLDAEGGGKHYRSGPKIEWIPTKNSPPEANGWETCLVHVRDYETVAKTLEYLQSGRHPFKSIIMDSLTEVQKRLIDHIVGIDQPRIQDWGEILRTMEKQVRDFRDLTLHPTNPVSCIVFICPTGEKGTDPHSRPYLQGQLGITMPYYTDVVGAQVAAQDPDDKETMLYYLIVKPVKNYIAKDRTDKLGTYLQNPNIVEMFRRVYGDEVLKTLESKPEAVAV